MADPTAAAVPQMPQMPQLTMDQAKAALAEAIAAFEEPANDQRMRDAIAGANGDPMLMMTTVMPVAMEIQAEVLSRYGFDRSQPAVMNATMQMQMLSQQDPEMAAALAQLKAKFMPTPAAAAPAPAAAQDEMD